MTEFWNQREGTFRRLTAATFGVFEPDLSVEQELTGAAVTGQALT